ncbi:TIGR03943 family protein [Alteribacillus sp. JSM 102045]|uniref:TIGR03943 family putative permease subunit n=1 Tax=Alteribacillus sp. JSM 102045 TaxID=1562101 RepID=UPI0035C1BFFD
MRFSFQQFLRAVILAVFAAFFIRLHYSGDITKIVNPKYEVLSQTAGAVFVFLTLIQITRVWKPEETHHHCSSGCTHHHGYDDSFLKKCICYGILMFPLITGFALPPETLNSSVAENKGTMLSQGNRIETGEKRAEESTTDLHDQEPLPNNNYFQEDEYEAKMKDLEALNVIEMKDDIFSSYYDAIHENPRDFAGKTIKLKGFTYKEEGLPSNQLVISRFIITHCIADAGVLGWLTEFEQADSYEEDIWMEIEGTLKVATYNGVELPLIKAERGRVIEEPSNPYVYPVLRKMTE